MPDTDYPLDIEDAEIVAAYLAGQTIEKLAASYNLSYRNVRTRLVNAGVTLRPQQKQMVPTPPGLVAAYCSGLSIRQTGTQFGLSYNVARRMLLQAGIGLRSRGQAPSL